MGEDETDVEDTSGYAKSGVQLGILGWEDLVSVKLHAGSGLVPAINWGWSIHSHTKFPKSQFLMMICPISLLLVLNSTIT